MSNNIHVLKNGKLTEWKKDLLESIPEFGYNVENRFDKFYRMALVYTSRHGHANIKKNDVIDGYKIGQTYNDLFKDFRKNRLTIEQIEKLQSIGVDITVGKQRKLFTTKIELARQAVAEGVIIGNQNRFYHGVELYNWFRAR